MDRQLGTAIITDCIFLVLMLGRLHAVVTLVVTGEDCVDEDQDKKQATA